MTAYLLARLRRGRWRAVTVVAGVAIGTALFVAVSLLGAAFREAAGAPLRDVGADLVLTRTSAEHTAPALRGIRLPEGLGTFDAAEVAEVAATDRVTSAAGSLTLWDFGPRQTLVVAGVDPDQNRIGPGRLLAENVVAGRAFRSGERGVAVADMHYAQFYDLRVGDQVTVGGDPFRLVGVLEVTGGSQAAAANLFVPIDQARELAGLDSDTVNEIHVGLSDASETDAVVGALDDQLGGISAITADSLVQVFGAVGRVSARFSTIAAVVGVLGGVLLAWLAMQAMVQDRAREIGLLKAVGWRGRDVVRLVRTEALVLSGLGAVVGVVLGIVAAVAFAGVPLPAAPVAGGPPAEGGSGVAPAEVTVEVVVDPLVLLVGAVAAVLAGTLAGMLTARRAARISPARNLTAL